MKRLLKYKMAKIADNSSNEGQPEKKGSFRGDNLDLKSIETTQKSLEHKLAAIRSPMLMMVDDSSRRIPEVSEDNSRLVSPKVV
jgi:hypothetical protein